MVVWYTRFIYIIQLFLFTYNYYLIKEMVTHLSSVVL